MDAIEDFAAYEKYWGPRFRAIENAEDAARAKRLERRQRNLKLKANGGTHFNVKRQDVQPAA